jgi:hypothetical protein
MTINCKDFEMCHRSQTGQSRQHNEFDIMLGGRVSRELSARSRHSNPKLKYGFEDIQSSHRILDIDCKIRNKASHEPYIWVIASTM